MQAISLLIVYNGASIYVFTVIDKKLVCYFNNLSFHALFSLTVKAQYQCYDIKHDNVYVYILGNICQNRKVT